MKALVTGASGFIGGAVAQALLRRGHLVRVLLRPGSSPNLLDPGVVRTRLRARAFTRKALAPLTDADIDRHFRRVRRDGSELEATVGWALYHVLEHEAGHYGQINLLRHQYRLVKEKR